MTLTFRVHFSISTYVDYVDCDVVPMQACSLLLGRNNQYTLVHKDKHIALLLMSPEHVLKDDINRE